MEQNKVVLDYFSDDDLKNILDYITSHTEEYYKDTEATTHPTSLFLYGVRNNKVDGQIYYIGSPQNNEEYFEELGYSIGKQLDGHMVPFLVVISVEAWLYIYDVETESEQKVEGISVAGLTVDGRAVACHQLIERDDNNIISIVKTEQYENASPGYLESFYDGMRNYYVETLDKEK